MATYQPSNFEEMAIAIGVNVGWISTQQKMFEAAALEYRLSRRRDKPISPSKMREKLQLIANHAGRLLKSLGVDPPREAADGPVHRDILSALVLVGERTEDPVIDATRRIGRLAELIDGVAAAVELQDRAKKAAAESPSGKFGFMTRRLRQAA